MKAYELYEEIFNQSKKDGREYLRKNLDVLRFFKKQGILQRLWEDYDDQRLDCEIKNFSNDGIIKDRLPVIGEWVVTVAVVATVNKIYLTVNKTKVQNKNYHNILPQDAFNYRNVGVVYFTNESYADEFIIYLKLCFANQYTIEIES